MAAKYPLHYYIIGSLIVLISICAGYILYQQSGTDYHRAVDAVERAQEKQRKSIDLNQGVQDAVDRSTELNNQAAERIERIESYQQRAKERIDESSKRLDDAAELLERNQRIFDAVESRPQAQQSHGATP